MSIAIGTCDVSSAKAQDSLHAVDSSYRANLLTISPGLLLLYPNISYWRAITPHWAIGGGFHVPWPEGVGSTRPVSGYGVRLEPRYYPSGRGFGGIYFAGHVSFGRITSEGETVTPISAGGIVGWDVFTEPRRRFNFGFGVWVDHYFSYRTIKAYNGVLSYSDVYSTNGLMHGGGTDRHPTIPGFRFHMGVAW